MAIIPSSDSASITDQILPCFNRIASKALAYFHSFAQQLQDVLHPAIMFVLATMLRMEPYHPPITAPDFPPGTWLNTLEPVTNKSLSGKLTLLVFFDFTCINCLHTLPYLRAWKERYEELGLALIGIHTPEFKFAHEPAVVRAGANRLGINWPILLDNDQTLWTAYANRYWPSFYLIDGGLKIHFRHVGEGDYQSMEKTIQQMLLAQDPDLQLPQIMGPVRAEDAVGAVCAPTSPEMQLGSIDRIDVHHQDPIEFSMPTRLESGTIYLSGSWRVTHDGVTLTGAEGEIAMRYDAAKVYGIFGPKPEDRERLPSYDEPLYIQVLQDDEPLSRTSFGEDMLAIGSAAHFRVDTPRLYRLVENPGVGTHELRLTIFHPGLTFYAFSFDSCATNVGTDRSTLKE